MEKANQVLRETFGLSSFRLSQEAVIRRLLIDGENALVLYPTGGKLNDIDLCVVSVCIDITLLQVARVSLINSRRCAWK